MTDYPYVWFLRKWPRSSWDSPGSERKGQRCRLLASGARRSALVEFEDGYQVVTSLLGLRKAAR